MASRFIISVMAFSLTYACVCADDAHYEEISLEELIAVEELPAEKVASESKEVKKEPLPKKMKSHFVGVKRPQPKSQAAGSEKKKSTHIKNQWFSSKTHPKIEKKEEVKEKSGSNHKVDDLPHFIKTNHVTQQKTSNSINPKTSLTPQEDPIIPQSANTHIFVSAEWLYWRTCQEGMEFAMAKKVEFDFQSGFRVGLGVHLPLDRWDIFINYTRFTPKASNSAYGFFYPRSLFNADNVTQSNATWKINFQTLDIEIGRAYSVTKSLSLRPCIGLKGAWIDQNGKITCQGGFIEIGQIARTVLENDFKGAGPLLGIESNWELGTGFSFFGNLTTALIAGQFNNNQIQNQLDPAKGIAFNTRSNLVSPTVQIITGLAWNHNFNRDQCRVSLGAGFETQYFWNQNQTEQFTDAEKPIYIREKGDLAFYGLTLRGRFDF